MQSGLLTQPHGNTLSAPTARSSYATSGSTRLCAAAAARGSSLVAVSGVTVGPEGAGAEVVEVGIPDLHLCRIAHSAILGSDSFQDFKRRHGATLRRSINTLSHDLQARGPFRHSIITPSMVAPPQPPSVAPNTSLHMRCTQYV